MVFPIAWGSLLDSLRGPFAVGDVGSLPTPPTYARKQTGDLSVIHSRFVSCHSLQESVSSLLIPGHEMLPSSLPIITETSVQKRIQTPFLTVDCMYVPGLKLCALTGSRIV